MEVEDRVFEGLPRAAALDWPRRFSSAIPAGADLSSTWAPFAIWLMRAVVLPGCAASEFAAVRDAAERVALGYETGWTSEGPARVALVAEVAAADAAKIYQLADPGSKTEVVSEAVSYAGEAAYASARARLADCGLDYINYGVWAYTAVINAVHSVPEAAGLDRVRQTRWTRIADKLCELVAACPAAYGLGAAS